MVTAIGAYLMGAAGAVSWPTFAVGMAGLAAAVAGSTALNMVLDRDIDRVMDRTGRRPLPSGRISVARAWVFGLGLAGVGLAGSWAADALFGLVVTLGLLFDVVVYTMWLKRRSAASILIGGIAGGMPALAGRVLAIGAVDVIGLLLAAGVVLWIPAHILTLAMRHADEYGRAGVPVWPAVHGEESTRRVIAVATAGAAGVLLAAGLRADVHAVALAGLGLAGAVMVALSLLALLRPSERRNWTLFKAASIYMAFAFVCLTLGSVI
jgi:protoheme IX farnesyltransferase